MIKVFVYGTLKRGQFRGDVLPELCKARYKGVATTVEPVIFLDTGPFPMICDRHPDAIINRFSNEEQCAILGGDFVLPINVKGEVWDVPDDKLEILDEIEGHPTFYRRKGMWVRKNSGEIVRVLTYTIPPEVQLKNPPRHLAFGAKIMTSPVWKFNDNYYRKK